MMDRIFPYACICLGLMVAGCNPSAPAWSPSMAEPKPLHVDYVRLQQPLAFATGTANLAAGEAEALTAFLDNAEVTADDHVYIEAASNDRLAAQRIGQLQREMGRRGIAAETLPPLAAGVPNNRLIVLVERYVVTPPDSCPDWTKDPVSNHGNTVASNFGCATGTNFALMIADPRDLVIGRKMGPEVGDPALAAVERFREGKPKALLGGASAGASYAPVAVGMPSGGGQ